MSVSSTRPSGPPPKRRGWLSRAIRSGKLWTGIATFLGIFATVWAIVVGQTLKELLAESPVPRFQRQTDAVCAASLAQLFPSSEVVAGLPFPTIRAMHRLRPDAISAELLFRLPDFAEVEAPAQFKKEYEEFQRGLRDLYSEMVSLQFTLRVHRASEALAISRHADSLRDDADLMSLDSCARLSGVLNTWATHVMVESSINEGKWTH